MNCDSCLKEIAPEFGYIEINITYWNDKNAGDSIKIVWHKTCEQDITTKLMRFNK